MTNPNANHRRLARLQRECEVSIEPVLLLAAVCAVVIVVLALKAVLEEVRNGRCLDESSLAIPGTADRHEPCVRCQPRLETATAPTVPTGQLLPGPTRFPFRAAPHHSE